MSHIVIVVLGDLGRSPRMQNHAYSCAALPEVARVSLVGYTGERCIDEVENNDKIYQTRFSVYDCAFLKGISFLHTILKGLLMLIQLCVILGSLPTYDVILIQNPPALPAIFAALILDLVNPFYQAKTIIDWHNLGFSMFIDQYDMKKTLSLKDGEEDEGARGVPLIVRLSKLLEHSASGYAAQHFCVSEAMKLWLIKHFDIPPQHITVVYDRPPASFYQSISVQEKTALLKKLKFTYNDLFENSNDNTGKQSIDFPIVISATSWTPDEDFTVLLTALLDVDTKLALLNRADHDRTNHKGCVKGVEHKLLVVVTGKGPTRAAFEAEVARYSREGHLQHIAIRTAWLEPADYPRLLRSASLGICLHTSTSGLDLPMKVLDMFGCALPVLAVDFPTITELVQHEVNGLLFDEKKPLELSEYLMQLLYVGNDRRKSVGNDSVSTSRHSITPSTLSAMKVATANIGTWENNWKQSAHPIISAVIKQKGVNIIYKVLIYVSLLVLILAITRISSGVMDIEERNEL